MNQAKISKAGFCNGYPTSAEVDFDNGDKRKVNLVDLQGITLDNCISRIDKLCTKLKCEPPNLKIIQSKESQKWIVTYSIRNIGKAKTTDQKKSIAIKKACYNLLTRYIGELKKKDLI